MTTALKAIVLPNSVFTDEYRFMYCLDVRCKCGFNCLSVYQEKETDELFTSCGLCLSIEWYEETREEMREATSLVWIQNLYDLLDVVVKCSPQGTRNELIEYLIVREAKRLAEYDKDAEKGLTSWQEWKATE